MKNNLFRSISVVAMVCLLYLQGCTINNNEDDDGVDVTDTGTAIRRSTDNIGVSTDSVSDSIAGSDSESVTDTASIGTDEGDTGTATETASDDTASAADTAIVDTQTVIDTATTIDTDSTVDTASQVDTGVDTNTATDTVVETPTETVDTTWSDWIFGDYASSTDSDSIIDSDSDFEICEAVTVEFEQILARAVILLDKSGSMGTSNVGGVSLWELATNAVEDIVTGYENDISFGFDTFPRDNSSAIYEQILMDVAPLNADPILAEMSTLSANGGTPLLESIKQYVSQYTYYSLATDTDSDTTLDTDTNTDTGVDPNQCPFACSSICDTITGLPVGGTCNGIGEQCCDLRPQYSLPENAVWRKYAPIFMDGTGQSYLIVISDGEDYSATPEILGEFARIMLQQYGIRSIAIGFGAGASEEQLNAIAANGGTPFTTFLDAADGAELTTALNSIAQVVAVSCDFDLGSFDEDVVDYDKVIVTFDGEMVPRNDSDCAGNQGWSWRDASRTAIHLCDFACSDLQKQNVENLEIEIACHEGDVIVE